MIKTGNLNGGAFWSRLVSTLTVTVFLSVGLYGCGEGKSPQSKGSPLADLVMQTFNTPANFNIGKRFAEESCTTIVDPKIKLMIEGKATNAIPADPSKALPAAFAQLDFVCENKVLGSRKPSTIWVLVAYDSDFKTPRCQFTTPATKKPFQEQFSENANLVCKFSPDGPIPNVEFQPMV